MCVCFLKMQMFMLKYELFDRRCCQAPSQHQILHSCLVLIEFYCFIKQPHCQYLIAYTWPLQTNTTEIASIFQRVLQLGSYSNSLCTCKNFLGSIMTIFSYKEHRLTILYLIFKSISNSNVHCFCIYSNMHQSILKKRLS